VLKGVLLMQKERVLLPEMLVIIPARGGSKGIPRKNIIDVCGQPLIAYTIECAGKSKYVTRTVVSTDDEDIAAVARHFGADVPFLRPKEIAGSRAAIEDSVHHTLRELAASGYHADIHAILLPTHPFRTPKMINDAAEKILEGYHDVHTVRSFSGDDRPWCVPGEKGYLIPLIPKKLGKEWRQGWYRPYGCLSVYSAVRNPKGTFLFPITNPIEFIDIDTRQDLQLAKLVIQNNLYNFNVE
jgi:CMP-N-acetylneuraminic acid synthetase